MPSPDAYERMVERYLASPHYGERWGKYWLDAAGYADSNGYFNADTDRPLAYRYRDYVIRALNADKPFDQFVARATGRRRAGGLRARTATSRRRWSSCSTATHFLRNAQDGTGESDGNPDEVRDRPLRRARRQRCRSSASSLLGLTIQCARCHDHKFEPITQQRLLRASSDLLPGVQHRELGEAERTVRLGATCRASRRPGRNRSARSRSRDSCRRRNFATGCRRIARRATCSSRTTSTARRIALAERWSNTAPGDDAPAGDPAGAARLRDGAGRADHGRRSCRSSNPARRRIAGLSTQQAFDWTPRRRATGSRPRSTWSTTASTRAASRPSGSAISSRCTTSTTTAQAPGGTS